MQCEVSWAGQLPAWGRQKGSSPVFHCTALWPRWLCRNTNILGAFYGNQLKWGELCLAHCLQGPPTKTIWQLFDSVEWSSRRIPARSQLAGWRKGAGEAADIIPPNTVKYSTIQTLSLQIHCLIKPWPPVGACWLHILNCPKLSAVNRLYRCANGATVPGTENVLCTVYCIG